MDTAALTLIERLAERLCHDFASSAQAVASGLDLLSEARGDAERDEAQAFLAEAVAAQKAKIAFARRAYGPASADPDPAGLEGLAQALFADIRPDLDWPDLDWGVAAETPGPGEGRALLILAQLGADILAAGGLAHLTFHRSDGRIQLDAEGPRPRLGEDLRAGLAGERSEGGLSGRWVQGAFLRALSDDLSLDESPNRVRITLALSTGR